MKSWNLLFCISVLGSCVVSHGLDAGSPSLVERQALPKASANANWVIKLRSNVDHTRFLVDEKPMGTASELKVLVNSKTEHTIVAEAPGYLTKSQFIQPDYTESNSLVSFTFSYRDRIHGEIAGRGPGRGPSRNGWDEKKWNGFGKYHALIIANQNYGRTGWGNLRTPEKDAVALKTLLIRKYDFDNDKINIFKDATRKDIIDALIEYREDLGQNDNLLIYFAGHGAMDPGTKRGYWIPVDGDRGDRSSWLTNDDVTNEIKAMRANHVLVIADSCYSGSFIMRGDSEPDRTGPNWARNYSINRSRKGISSGALQPVDDSRFGEHSIFSKALLEVLETYNDYLDSVRLYDRVIKKVANQSGQTPQYGGIPEAGDDGGQFIFVPKAKGSAE